MIQVAILAQKLSNGSSVKIAIELKMPVFTEKLMLFGSQTGTLLFHGVLLINSSSIFGRRVLFLAAKTGTPFHFFLLKVEWGAIFGPFRFWHDSPTGKHHNYVLLHMRIATCILNSRHGV